MKRKRNRLATGRRSCRNIGMEYDKDAPWNKDVKGSQVLPLINDDKAIIRVEAGPGTGKTFGLIRRVQRLLHPAGLAVKGDRIVIVAFNRVIAKKLSEDIRAALKHTDHEQGPIIKTVHGFCLHVIGGETRILLPHERVAMLCDLMHERPELLEKYPTRKKLEQALHDHEANRVPDLTLWEAVQHWLTRHKARLISDLPMMLSDGIKGGDFSEHQFDHVIVDEFQDLTPAEQDLFFRLRATNGQFVALGDPRQSIYAFRGNDRMGLAKLNSHPLLGDAEIHDCPMSECQRCPRELVKAANQLMALSNAQPMTSTSGRSGTINVVYWKTPESEAKGMAKLIAANIKKFPKDSHLAMVTRRSFGFRLRDEIYHSDPRISVDLAFTESILESWPVREAFLFASLICDPDPATWRSWFAYRQPKDAENGENVSDRNAPAYLNFLTACNDNITENLVFPLAGESRTKNRGGGGSNIWDRAVRFKELRDAKKWNDLEPEKLIKAVFSSSLWPSFDPNETRMAADDLKIIKASALQNLADITEEEPELSSIDQLQKVFRHLRYSIATKEPLTEGVEADLQVTTLWGGKGLTADHVYVIGLCDEAIPGHKTPEYPGTDADFKEEQRRLFYVTITRAKRTMMLSRPKKIRPGDASRLKFQVKEINGNYAKLEMSSFLRSIMNYLPPAQDGETLLSK